MLKETKVSIPHRYGTTKRTKQDQGMRKWRSYVSIPHRYGTTEKQRFQRRTQRRSQFLIGTVLHL